METDEEVARRREAAAKQEEDGYEIDWKQLRKKKIGYILKMKFTGSESRKMLAEWN